MYINIFTVIEDEYDFAIDYFRDKGPMEQNSILHMLHISYRLAVKYISILTQAYTLMTVHFF